ncbi:hypothetical protein JOQ06_020898, partial [Pogonophryne albipinna]
MWAQRWIAQWSEQVADMQCLLPMNFDHFQILRAIGKGSFGKVRQENRPYGPYLSISQDLRQTDDPLNDFGCHGNVTVMTLTSLESRPAPDLF